MSEPDLSHPCIRTTLEHLSHSGPVYVATPYSQWAERGLASDAYHAAIHWQTFIAMKGYTGVSPIVLGHVMSVDWPHDKWLSWCRPLLDASASVFIPPIAGRWESEGIAWEMARALSQQKPVVVWG